MEFEIYLKEKKKFITSQMYSDNPYWQGAYDMLIQLERDRKKFNWNIFFKKVKSFVKKT